MGLVVAAVVLGPLLVAGGTVLLHDMVFVPRQPLSGQALGLGTGLPRAVPVDAVVSALTTVVPGAVLQRLVLSGVLVGAAVGAGRLCPGGRLARTAAALAFAWNPWVAERLVLGQWALLVAYAALPWVVGGGLAVRRGEAGGVPRTLLAAALASLTPTGGLLALAAASASAGRRAARVPLLTAGLLLLQAPWVVAGVLHPAGGTSDPAGVAAFAVRAENWSGVLGTLLGLGGVWNEQVVPASRATAVAPLATLLALLVAAVGSPVLVRRWGRRPSAALGALGLGGLLLAAAGALPGGAAALRWLVEHVPGSGLLRDGHKWLAPLALLLAVCAGLGCERLARSARPLGLLAVVVPVAVTPDLALGASGRLQPTSWPDDWSQVRSALEADPRPGAVVPLPFTAYRAYDWNGGRPSLDPAPRWFDRDVVVDDRLRVGGTLVAGEDLAARRVAAALEAGRPLGQLGVGWVVVQHGTPGPVPLAPLAGAAPVHEGPDLSLYRLPDVAGPPAERPAALPVVTAHVAAGGVALLALATALRRRRPSVAPRADDDAPA